MEIKVRLVKMSKHDAWAEWEDFFVGKVYTVKDFYPNDLTPKPHTPHHVRLHNVDMPKGVVAHLAAYDERPDEFIFVSIEDNWEVVESKETNKTK